MGIGGIYLVLAEIGFFKAFDMKKTENSNELIIGMILTCSMVAECIPALLSFFFPNSFDSGVKIINFSLSMALCTGAFLFFIYWNFLKCKDR